jgi:hypothetical protein
MERWVGMSASRARWYPNRRQLGWEPGVVVDWLAARLSEIRRGAAVVLSDRGASYYLN